MNRLLSIVILCALVPNFGFAGDKNYPEIDINGNVKAPSAPDLDEPGGGYWSSDQSWTPPAKSPSKRKIKVKKIKFDKDDGAYYPEEQSDEPVSI